MLPFLTPENTTNTTFGEDGKYPGFFSSICYDILDDNHAAGPVTTNATQYVFSCGAVGNEAPKSVVENSEYFANWTHAGFSLKLPSAMGRSSSSLFVHLLTHFPALDSFQIIPESNQEWNDLKAEDSEVSLESLIWIVSSFPFRFQANDTDHARPYSLNFTGALNCQF